MTKGCPVYGRFLVDARRLLARANHSHLDVVEAIARLTEHAPIAGLESRCGPELTLDTTQAQRDEAAALVADLEALRARLWPEGTVPPEVLALRRVVRERESRAMSVEFLPPDVPGGPITRAAVYAPGKPVEVVRAWVEPRGSLLPERGQRARPALRVVDGADADGAG